MSEAYIRSVYITLPEPSGVHQPGNSLLYTTKYVDDDDFSRSSSLFLSPLGWGSQFLWISLKVQSLQLLVLAGGLLSP